MSMSTVPVEEEILRRVLNRWKSSVDAHAATEAASLFAEDAIFQGLHDYTVGRAGIAEYYDSQPLGMIAEYKILETRRLTDTVVLGYTHVEFSFPDRPTVSVYLSLLVRQADGDWWISHYQVSKLP
jgi:uncharacterized protein (TIGR02246 family)